MNEKAFIGILHSRGQSNFILISMLGNRFKKFNPENRNINQFNKLLRLFLELLTYTSGNYIEALKWLKDLDKEFQLTASAYGIEDFIRDLKANNYLEENKLDGTINITPKTERAIRQNALEEIFGKIRNSLRGDHKTNFTGIGDELSSDRRAFQFGDSIDQIDITDSIRNSQINHGIESFSLTEEDLEVQEREYKAQTSTVLMIDVSHSMILYGEDRITPAKKVAMALSELIMTRYPKDTLDIIAFGNEAWTIQVKDLPYLQVGPYHTNTVAGLELAMDILRRRKTHNKQIFMITDGKPTCLKIGIKYYKNSFGLDSKILNKTLDMAAICRRRNIEITTFMIARDSYLQQFVREFTKVNNGRAFYSSLTNLGEFVFEDYIRNRKKRIR